jgi:succinate dehydrogenase hydrophobic anchor subunit
METREYIVTVVKKKDGYYKYMFNIASGVILVLILVSGFLYYKLYQSS